ncbi:MAG TPA: C4-dicarboxylate ABC transporter permease [Rhodobacteraceae bacterium]|nr:C4-dicarboxylate ABC transporter permease [Paracoccaceae bacterium]
MAVLGIFAMVLVLLVMRQNIIVILLASAAYVHLVWGEGRLGYLAEDLWISLDNPLLLAIPMFLLAGNLMTRGSIVRRLINLAIEITKPLPGGLAVATIISCAVFAGISGSSPVTLLAVGSVMYPALLANGYSKRFALGALTSGGTLGIVIPPSIPLILYGIVTENSIADLFLAGVIPGLMITLVLAVYSLWVNRNMPAQKLDLIALKRSLREGIWALMLPVIMLGGIYSGYFSATEAAAVALAYGILVETFVYREIKLLDAYETALETARLLGMLFPIVAVALSLKTILTIENIPDQLALWITDITSSRVTFLLAVNALLLLVGCLFDVVSAILVLAPLLLIPAVAYGIDPIHFGILMVINLEIGFLTPPMGLNLIVAMTAFKESFGTIVRSVLPFVFLIFSVLLIVTFVPWTALALTG